MAGRIRTFFLFTVVVTFFCGLVSAQNTSTETPVAGTSGSGAAAAPAVEPAKKEAPVVVKEAKEAPVAVKEAPAASKEANKDNIIKGTVKEIAEDGSYLVVNDTKIAATKEFLDDSYLEVGDKVEITVEKTATGLKATNYNYVFEEEEGAGVDEKTGGAAGGNVADAGSNATDLGGE